MSVSRKSLYYFLNIYSKDMERLDMLTLKLYRSGYALLWGLELSNGFCLHPIGMCMQASLSIDILTSMQ